MAYEIIWLPVAEQDFDAIIEFVSERWSPEIAIDFVQQFYKKLDFLVEMPYLGVKSNRFADVRRILINKHISLLYKVRPSDETIVLLRVIDNRSNFKF